MRGMQALILAGGWATRLKDVAQGTPKHLLPIGDRSSLDFLVEHLNRIPFLSAIHIVTHDVYFPQFVDWVAANPSRTPIKVLSDGTASVDERLGSLGDIAFFLHETGPNDDVLVIAGDNVFDFDLKPFAERARAEPVVGIYDVGRLDLATRYGVVVLDDGGYITSFVEKPANPMSTLAAIAIYGLPRQYLGDVDRYLAEGNDPDKLGSLMEWMHTRRRVAGHVFQGRWIDVGSPDEYERVNALFGGEARHERTPPRP